VGLQRPLELRVRACGELFLRPEGAKCRSGRSPTTGRGDRGRADCPRPWMSRGLSSSAFCRSGRLDVLSTTPRIRFAPSEITEESFHPIRLTFSGDSHRERRSSGSGRRGTSSTSLYRRFASCAEPCCSFHERPIETLPGDCAGTAPRKIPSTPSLPVIQKPKAM